MLRASGLINLLLMGSVMTALAVVKARHQSVGYYDNAGVWHPTTQPSGGSPGYYYHGIHYYGTTGYGSGYYGGSGYSGSSSSGATSGISHGGFGATGHAVGGHA